MLLIDNCYLKLIMPKKEIQDYIFYKIACLDDSCDLFYIGSTANWKARNYTHKHNCTNENSTKYNYKVYQTIRENGGWYNFKMIQIGTREQLTKRQAEEIEDVYRLELKASMNGRRCYTTEEQKREYQKEYHKEYYEANEEYFKEYREANKEHKKEINKEYREANKDKIKEYNKDYNTKNKDKIKEHNKKYKEVNKDNLKAIVSQKINCECGCQVRRDNLSTHKKTQKHLDLVQNS